MPELTPAERNTLDSQVLHSAQVDWYLALAPYGDPTFTARINNAVANYGDREIIYDGDVGEASIVAGMTLWVGTSANAYDVGKVRIRSVNVGTNTITVAENDHIEWADDLYLTCPGSDGFHELWGIYSRITEAAFVVTFFEDYDIVYNDPVDDVIPPKANGGPPIPTFLNDDGYIDISFVGDESFTTEVGAAILSYTWDFADGVVQSGGVFQAGTCAAPNVVRFSTTGFRYVTLTVVDNTAQNRSGIVYIPVWTFDPDEMPIAIEMVSMNASPHWSAQFKVFDPSDAISDGALCAIFTRTTYPDGTNGIGGFCHRSEVHFVGWLDKESLSWSIDGGTVTYTALGHCSRLDQLPGFAYTLEEEPTPSDWYMVADLNFDRAAHIHFERRCTINRVAHVNRLGEGNTRTIAIQPYPDASIYTQLQEHLAVDAMASVLADRQGIIHIRRDPQFMTPVDRNGVDVVTTLEVDAILGILDELKDHQPQLGYIRLGGFAFETPLLAEAPGIAPRQSESSDHEEGFIVINQVELTWWAAAWLCKKNAPYKTVPVELNGYWPVFDPAFQEYVRMTIADPLGHNPLVNQRFIVKEVEFKSMPADGTSVTRMVLEMEAPLCSGNYLDIPAPPELTTNPPPGFPTYTIPTPDIAIVHDRAEVYSTPDFNALNPTWTNITGLLEGVIFAVECDHFDGVGGWALTGTDGVNAEDDADDVGLWRTDDITVGAPVWTLVFTQEDGKLNKPLFIECVGGEPDPGWGQLRSLNPTAAGECIISEARWHGLNYAITDQTMIYKVDSIGSFEFWNSHVGIAPSAIGWWQSCDQCGEGSPFNANVAFLKQSTYVNQGEFRGCHQVFYGDYGDTTLCPAGLVHLRDAGGFCFNPGDCELPWACQIVDPWPRHPDATVTDALQGATHVVLFNGVWWAQTQQDNAFHSAGGLYNTIDGEVDSDLWRNYAFCNICSHPTHIYHCKQDTAVTAGTNELYMDLVATGVTSDLLFGGNGPGYDASPIGHIRAIWDDVGTVVLVLKKEPSALQPNDSVVWTWDPVTGLQDKTGNLSGITWRGTGGSLPPAGSNYRWDNVGFSAFQVPLK